MDMKLHDFEMIEQADRPGAYQCVLDYGDTYQLSIISGKGAYGGDRGLYEIAIFKDGDFTRLPGIFKDDHDDDVIGHLTEGDVNAIIFKMFFITGQEPEQV
jgi:hypothetical protein